MVSTMYSQKMCICSLDVLLLFNLCAFLCTVVVVDMWADVSLSFNKQNGYERIAKDIIVPFQK